jgi:DNA polymerase-1
MKPATRDGFRLFTQGAIALSKMESEGLPVDTNKLAVAQREVQSEIRDRESKLRKHDIYGTQQRRYGAECNLNSREQLGWVLYDFLKLPGAKKSKKSKKYILDEDALLLLDSDYVAEFLQLQKLYKLKGTYLDALERDCVKGRVHGFLNLHNVKSFRGSADSPNLNNLPSRNKSVTKYVKGCVCPPEGWYIVEIDYSALEVHVAACYHKDTTMIDNLESGFDMHSATAKQCFKYDDAWATENKALAKTLRTAAKGDAVFGWFYGNYYVDVARRLWKTAGKTGMLEHLSSVGIKRLGIEFDEGEQKWVANMDSDTFVSHIKSVEDDFWGKRYRTYAQWKKDWYREYLAKGYFHTLTGFLWRGVETRNFIINAGIQGDAAHCLLQAIIDIQKEIETKKMQSRLFLEIHDSLLGLVPASELHDFVGMANHYMTTALRKKWGWILLDLKTETELSPISWADKQVYTGNET